MGRRECEGGRREWGSVVGGGSVRVGEYEGLYR